MEKKIATPEIAGKIWRETTLPNCTKVREKLLADGYAVPSLRTFTKWQAKHGWPKVDRKAKNYERETGERKIAGAKATQKAAMQAVAEALTGKEDAKPEDIVPILTGKPAEPPAPAVDAEQQYERDKLQRARQTLKEGLDDLAKCKTVEELLEGVSVQALKTGFVYMTLLRSMAEYMVIESPEACGKIFEAVATSLEAATAPLDRKIALREALAKTIGVVQPDGSVAELLPPEEDDPLAASFKAVFANGHGARA